MASSTRVAKQSIVAASSFALPAVTTRAGDGGGRDGGPGVRSNAASHRAYTAEFRPAGMSGNFGGAAAFAIVDAGLAGWQLMQHFLDDDGT